MRVERSWPLRNGSREDQGARARWHKGNTGHPGQGGILEDEARPLHLSDPGVRSGSQGLRQGTPIEGRRTDARKLSCGERSGKGADEHKDGGEEVENSPHSFRTRREERDRSRPLEQIALSYAEKFSSPPNQL